MIKMGKNINYKTRFIQNIIFRVVTPCRLVDGYQHLRRNTSLYDERDNGGLRFLLNAGNHLQDMVLQHRR
jgi:hypothetical protein